ncbi:hypothetical protein TNCV_1710331 [Trichonephila clavipes]|nr:hypothetical protein TNCV_1710331 [Trichonephila clavipes]
MSCTLVPLRTRRVEVLVHAKSVEAQSPLSWGGRSKTRVSVDHDLKFRGFNEVTRNRQIKLTLEAKCNVMEQRFLNCGPQLFCKGVHGVSHVALRLPSFTDSESHRGKIEGCAILD